MKKIAILLSGLMLSTSVLAGECETKHADGEWVMYQAALDPALIVTNVNATRAHTGRCELLIEDGAGEVECEMTVNGGIAPVGTIDSVIVAEDCSVEMQMSFVINEYFTLVSNFDLQLSTNKQSFIGRWGNNTGVLGTTSGMKR